MKKRYIVIIVLLFLTLSAGLAALGFMAGVVNAKYKDFRNGGSLPEDYCINDIDVSGQNMVGAKDVIETTLGHRQIDLCGTNVSIGEFTEINAEIEPNDVKVFSYIKNSGSHETKISYSVNKKKLKNIINGLNHVEPENAKIIYVNGIAEIIPEELGSILKVTDELVKELENCIVNGTEPDLSEFYEKPEVTSDDLKNELEIASTWNNYKLKVTVNASLIKSFDVSKHLEWNGRKAVISDTWIKKKIEKFADKYNTYGRERNFITNSGEEIKVPGGTMGWLLDKDKTFKAVKKAVKKHKESIEPKWVNEGAVMWDSDVGNDIGDTYVEVSIGEQKVWYYDNGKVVLESSAVTGLPTVERQTKRGVHHILYKQRDRVLRGSARAWNSFVNYWMPFTLDGQGLHDASWRGSFGSNIYQYNGSHGCVNLPKEFAAQLYDAVETGVPVIVY